MRRVVLCCVGLLVGCLDERGPATAIDVSVKHDLDADELRAITFRVYPADADPAQAAPLSTHVAEGEALQRPLAIVHGRHRTLRIGIEGAGARGPVSYQAFARFEPEQTLALQVFLSRACLAKSCPAGQTCFGRAEDGGEPGSCGPVPMRSALVRVLEAGDESNWLPPRRGAGMPSIPVATPLTPDAVLDGGACDASGGRACEPLPDCSCRPGERCQVQGGQPVCTPARGVPIDGACRFDDDCAEGRCSAARTCAPACERDEECGLGRCVKLPDARFGACFRPCDDAAGCPPGLACSPLSWDGAARSACLNPLSVCPYRSNGRCDEPVIGSGLCAEATDPEDCVCDLVTQRGCADDQACQLVLDSGGVYRNTCVRPGPSTAGRPCKFDHDCARALACMDDGLCHRYCGSGADCSEGVDCYAVPLWTFKVCRIDCTPSAPACLPDSHCAASIDSKLGGRCVADR